MDLDQNEELLTAYLDRELSPDERATVDRALDRAPEARERLRELESTSRFLRSQPRLSLEEDFADGVIARLALEGTLRPAPAPPRRSRRRIAWWTMSHIGAAAAAVLVFTMLRGTELPQADRTSLPAAATRLAMTDATRSFSPAPAANEPATHPMETPSERGTLAANEFYRHAGATGPQPGDVVEQSGSEDVFELSIVLDREHGLNDIFLLCSEAGFKVARMVRSNTLESADSAEPSRFLIDGPEPSVKSLLASFPGAQLRAIDTHALLAILDAPKDAANAEFRAADRDLLEKSDAFRLGRSEDESLREDRQKADSPDAARARTARRGLRTDSADKAAAPGGKALRLREGAESDAGARVALKESLDREASEAVEMGKLVRLFWITPGAGFVPIVIPSDAMAARPDSHVATATAARRARTNLEALMDYIVEMQRDHKADRLGTSDADREMKSKGRVRVIVNIESGRN